MNLIIWTALLFVLLDQIESTGELSGNELLVPQFEHVPVPVTYYDAQSTQPIPLACRAWPLQPLSSVSYYTASRMSGSGGNRVAPAVHQVLLYPVRESLLMNESTGSTMLLSNPGDLAWLNEQEIHCVASTLFGSILSAPFRLLKAGMDDPPGLVALPSGNISVIRVHQDNVAVIRCHLPKSRPPAEVQFKRDGSLLTHDLGKHLLVHSLSGDYVDLLISAFGPNDQGVYQCVATNPVTRQMWTNPQSYRLELKRAPKTNRTRLIRGFAQRPELVVKEGDNLTLYCNFEAWPFRSSTVERVNRVPLDHERYHFEPRFGSLHLTQVRADDEGWYRCAVDNVTSTVLVRVNRQPRVSLSPAFVSVPPGTAVTLNCSSSGPSVPLWYFNGRIKLSQRSTGFDSQLFLPAVDASTTGVYQCVVRDSDNNWISAQSVVSLHSQRPVQRVDYNRLIQHMGPVKEWHTIVSRGLSSRLISLDCLPPEPHLTELSHWLSHSLPGRGSVASRLQLAHQLGFILVYWRKDGVQLKLPTPAHGPVGLLQLNLTVARSVDFGSYRCELWTAVRHVLFSHETQVKRLSPTDERNAPAPRQVMPSHKTKPDQLNRSTVLSAPVIHLDTSSPTNSKSNGTRLLDPTDRDKRNVLANRAQSARLDLMRRTTGSEGGVLAYADQANQPDSNIRAPSLDSHRSMLVSSPTLRVHRPNASTVGDNLAAWISWPAMKVDFYQVLFRTRLPMDTSWSKPFYAEERVVECCGQQPSCCQEIRQIYLTNRQHDRLEPGHLYEFRIRAFIGEALAGKSPWSNTISFEHISKVAPVITETVRLPDGGMLARWTLATSAVGFPIDHFLLLYRPETRFANGKTTYDGFQAVFLPSGNTWECTLHNLEPGKGYQIVVYGVHTPPGLDPQMSIFKGGIGGRRITQFSPEIFVKVKDTASESGVDAARGTAHSQNGDSSGTGRETGVAFNSAESNRLMFLILGALAGFMILIMICLVILCVWRQQRDKQRLLLYCNSTDGAGTKSADGFMEQPQQSRPLPGSGTFLLNHLNTLENEKSMIAGPHQSRQISQRSSLIYPQPPPMSPPPPPPPSALANQLACAHQDDTLEMASLMSDYAQQQQRHMLNPTAQHYPPAPPPPPPTLTAQIAVEPHQAYWAAQYPHLAMAGSKYSGQFIPINYYPSNSTMPNVPYGLKREPPSGGSVHDGTDTECDVMDQALALGRNEHFIQPRNPLSPGPSDMHGFPYQSVSPASFALGSASNGTYHPQPMVYDPGTQQQQQQQQQYNPVHCHRMQSVEADPNRNYPHIYRSYPPSMAPSNPGQPLVVTGSYNPGLEPNPRVLLPAQMSSSLSRAPDPDNARQDKLNGSLQSDNRHHYHHHRRRRRRLTADSGTSDNPERDEYRHTGTTDTGTPLMTSSPVTQEQSRAGVSQLEVNTDDQPPPLPQHHPSHGGTAYSHGGRYVQENYAQNISGNQPINGGIANWDRAYSSPGWPDQVRVLKMGYNVPPEVPAHRPYHIPGPLTYGNHNPSAGTATPGATTAPNSLTRRIPVGLLNGPPRVRDYSEYGIPNVHANLMQPPTRQENGVHGSMESMDPNGGPYVGTRPGVVCTTSDRRFAPLGQTTA